VQTKTKADAQAAVQERAEQIATQVGSALVNPKLSPSPCTGRKGESGGDVYSMQGAYQIMLPEAQHVPTAAKVRDAWKAAGWTITDDRTIGTSVVLTAKTPDDYSVDLESTAPPQAVALIIRTPCYRTSAPA
jgi:hypothetical protein